METPTPDRANHRVHLIAPPFSRKRARGGGEGAWISSSFIKIFLASPGTWHRHWRGGHVTALTLREGTAADWEGVRNVRYQLARGSTAGIHPWLADLESKVIRAEACYHAARQLQQLGYRPDSIIAHPGWGESLFLDEFWPQCPLGIHAELHYRATGGDGTR